MLFQSTLSEIFRKKRKIRNTQSSYTRVKLSYWHSRSILRLNLKSEQISEQINIEPHNTIQYTTIQYLSNKVSRIRAVIHRVWKTIGSPYRSSNDRLLKKFAFPPRARRRRGRAWMKEEGRTVSFKRCTRVRARKSPRNHPAQPRFSAE